MTDAVAPRASAVEVRTIDHIPLTERHGHAAQGPQLGVPPTISLTALWQIAYAPYVSDYTRHMPRDTGVRPALCVVLFLAAEAMAILGRAYFRDGGRYGRFSVSWIIGLAVICPLCYVLMRRTAGVGAQAPAVTGELFAPATKVAE
ncbi:hypothetical protein [Streptomyces shenzhenensis]|uniref:hypothetical protein n=1 Tax=Streptomyces shenzhenensis TaxID=943815 RepID=UPI0033DADFB6